ncbi:uncharacterized protein BYT42DRAFT_579445 [Radiomyces spectabilis]|uniref:uncharacterized protein n=1 Tax=Radiomyces spectabilis TaxID=64574 RepID=UPI00221F67E0|nr:uncharacterized protein BYT42DRAFT_579445 [Radiomyces spectabilis]KAI8373172.1 hypothetical protein BYT42DRAFT_579445 [Radiomyces spectabilis]
MTQLHRDSIHATCRCRIEHLLHRDDHYIFITSARQHSGGHTGKAFVVYQIRIGGMETYRRYSEFEALRNALTRLYPAIIIPPIPEKHSIVDYSLLQTRMKKDADVVEKRKRMLQAFLNRLARHPELGHNHTFHQFLDSDVVWADILRSPPLSVLPRNPLQMVLHKRPDVPIHAYNAILTNQHIPLPTNKQVSSAQAPHIDAWKQTAFRSASYMGHQVDKSQRKLMRRLEDLSHDYAELGAVYNGLSLNEKTGVAEVMDKVGQAMDASRHDIEHMVTCLEGEVIEPVQEQARFAQAIQHVLDFYHKKQAQADLIEMCLANKQAALASLLRMEKKSQHLTGFMTEQVSASVDPCSDATTARESLSIAPQPSEREMEEDPAAIAKRSPGYWSNGPSRMWSAVGHTLQGIVDADPQALRHQQLNKTKDAVSVISEARDIVQHDFSSINSSLSAQLGQFQQDKERDLRDILLAFAKIHARHCQKVGL